MATITIRYRIPSQNRRDKYHWSRCRRDRDTCLVLLRAACGGQQRPPEAARAITVTSLRWRLIEDHGNLVGGAKDLVDAIVLVGLLRDDADSWASIRYEQRRCPKDHDRTEIEVEGWEPRHATQATTRAQERRARRLAGRGVGA